MKITSSLKKSRRLLFLIPLLLAMFIPPASATGPSYLPGVKAGDQWTYGDIGISCSSFCPAETGVGFKALELQVQNVSGYSVGYNASYSTYGGGEFSQTGYLNTLNFSLYIIAGGLTAGDPVYNNTYAPTINSTVTRFYAGQDRTVNHLEYGSPLVGLIFSLYWDQASGALLELNETYRPNYNATAPLINIDLKVTSTNLWAPTLGDFSLSANSLSPTTINAGSTSSASITLASLRNLAGTITPSVTIAPEVANNPTGSFSPPSVTLIGGGTGSATLTVTTSPTTTHGNYTVLIIASLNATRSHFTTLGISVTGPDFSLNANPSQITTIPGATGTSQLMLTSLEGFTGAVSLSTSVSPPGLTATLSQNSVTLTSTATVTLTVQSSTLGSYTVNVTGTSGPTSHSTLVLVTVQSTPYSITDVNVGSSPGPIAYNPSNNYMYVANRAYPHTISVISGTSLVATIPITQDPEGIAYDPLNNYMYVLGYPANATNPDVVVVISGTTVLGTTTIGQAGQCEVDPGNIAFDPADGYMYVPNGGSNTVSILSGLTLVSTVNVSRYACQAVFNPSNNEMYVTGSTVTALKGTTLAANITSSGDSRSVVYDPSRREIYSASSLDVTAISNTTAVGSVSVSNLSSNYYEIDKIFYNPANNDIYVSTGYLNANWVPVISGLSIVANVTVGYGPGPIGFDPVDNTVFVASWANSTVSILKGTTVAYTLKAGSCSREMVFNPSNNDMYLTNECADTVSVIGTITSNPGFTVSAAPTVTVTGLGSRASVPATLQSFNGFTGTITLTQSTKPSGLSCNLNPNSITLDSTILSGTSTLSCSGTTPGAYTVTVIGTSNSIVKNATVTIYVSHSDYLPGLAVGDTATISLTGLTWTNNIPPQYFQEPSFIKLLNTTKGIDVVVTKVSGASVTYTQTWNYNNGTAPSIGYITENVATGAVNVTGDVVSQPSNGLLAAGLQAPDYILEDPSSPTFNATATRTVLGLSRTVNFLNTTATTLYGSFSNGQAWDQISGIEVARNGTFTFNAGTLGTARASFTAAITQTNVWGTSGKPTIVISSVNPSPASTGALVTVNFVTTSNSALTGLTVNWGDGSSTVTLSTTDTSATYAYSSTGGQIQSSFTINVTATNSLGSGSATATETVNDRPPTVTVSSVTPNPATTGQTVTVTFSATDPDGTIASYTINWGDTTTPDNQPGTAISDTHSYTSAGSYTITVTATDNSGSTGQNTISIPVNSSGKTTATLSVTCTPNQIVSAATASCAVTVSGSYPTGDVTFSSDSTTGSFSPSTGTCTLYYYTCMITYTDTAVTNTTATLSASYSGDSANTGASGTFSLKIVKPSSTRTTATLAVSCSSTSLKVGTFTKCTVTVTGSTPTGTVTLSTSSSTGSFNPSNGKCSLTTGTCSLTYTDISTTNATATISGSYSGDVNNKPATGTTSLAIVKPSTSGATATSSLTVSYGGATADQTSTTGVSVTITGSTAADGTAVAVNTQDLNSPSTNVGTVSLSGAKYVDVVVTGITSGNAKVCINYSSATSTTTMEYWSGNAWTSASSITVSGTTVCGQIPVSALTGTNVAVGNPAQPAAPQPTILGISPTLFYAIIGGLVALIVIVSVVVVVRRPKRTRTAS